MGELIQNSMNFVNGGFGSAVPFHVGPLPAGENYFLPMVASR